MGMMIYVVKCAPAIANSDALVQNNTIRKRIDKHKIDLFHSIRIANSFPFNSLKLKKKKTKSDP